MDPKVLQDLARVLSTLQGQLGGAEGEVCRAPIQITATLPYKSLPLQAEAEEEETEGSHTNHCGVPYKSLPSSLL